MRKSSFRRALLPAIRLLPQVFATTSMEAASSFRRGDSNRHGGVDIGDAVHVLLYLFTP